MTLIERIRFASARRSTLVVALALFGCDTSASDIEYVDLAVIVTPDGAAESPQMCLPVPMMPGGHTAKEARFEPGFTVRVEAVHDRVDVIFRGIYEPEVANRSLSREELTRDSFSDNLRIETLDNGRASVVLVAPCRPDPEDTDGGP